MLPCYARVKRILMQLFCWHYKLSVSIMCLWCQVIEFDVQEWLVVIVFTKLTGSCFKPR